jgi:hypothetical protein
MPETPLARVLTRLEGFPMVGNSMTDSDGATRLSSAGVIVEPPPVQLLSSHVVR